MWQASSIGGSLAPLDLLAEAHAGQLHCHRQFNVDLARGVLRGIPLALLFLDEASAGQLQPRHGHCDDDERRIEDQNLQPPGLRRALLRDSA
ncbi:uncharacterized protein LOC134533802 isoform X2 [Bacillus rossius redtenbacheri]|uniref:uncharacterized protein LOC134533802 isoform X2 n=1 Tax=Bacillus rossius redtenbacheri TaxID=93214 RepID=UPI002FDE69C4